MKNTTLIYIEKDGKTLMLHRTKKKNDLNSDLWIGVGGHCEEDESPEECAVREAKEETGLTLTDYDYRGIVTFVSDKYEGEYCTFLPQTALKANRPFATRAISNGSTAISFRHSRHGAATAFFSVCFGKTRRSFLSNSFTAAQILSAPS